jgi:hypothetical protein
MKAAKIGIDTGAAWGGPLTCPELPAMIFHQTGRVR